MWPNTRNLSKSTLKLTDATSLSEQFTIDDMRRQMDKVHNIRNMSVIAHVDHVRVWFIIEICPIFSDFAMSPPHQEMGLFFSLSILLFNILSTRKGARDAISPLFY